MDVMFDEDLRCWLLEFNALPGLEVRALTHFVGSLLLPRFGPLLAHHSDSFFDEQWW